MSNAPSPLLSRISTVFVVCAIIIALIAGYALIGTATITITPSPKPIMNSVDIVVGNTNGDSTFQILNGDIWSETVTLSKTFSVSEEYEEIEGQASGQITIINNNSKPQVLVATTRFLTNDKTLYRLDRQVTIPANSSVIAQITADKPGASGDRTGPEILSIPGLNPALQKKIYGELTGILSGGVIKRGKLTEKDVERGIKTVTDNIRYEVEVSRISDMLQQTGIPDKVSLPESLTTVEILDKKISETVGDLVDSFDIEITALVTGVSYDRNDLMQIAKSRLMALLPDGEELIELEPGALEISLQSIDSVTQTATLSAKIVGKTLITPTAQIISKDDIVGLNSKELKDYLESIPGIDKVSVDFSPFWVTRVPRLTNQITINIR